MADNRRQRPRRAVRRPRAVDFYVGEEFEEVTGGRPRRQPPVAAVAVADLPAFRRVRLRMPIRRVRLHVPEEEEDEEEEVDLGGFLEEVVVTEQPPPAPASRQRWPNWILHEYLDQYQSADNGNQPPHMLDYRWMDFRLLEPTAGAGRAVPYTILMPFYASSVLMSTYGALRCRVSNINAGQLAARRHAYQYVDTVPFSQFCVQLTQRNHLQLNEQARLFRLEHARLLIDETVATIPVNQMFYDQFVGPGALSVNLVTYKCSRYSVVGVPARVVSVTELERRQWAIKYDVGADTVAANAQESDDFEDQGQHIQKDPLHFDLTRPYVDVWGYIIPMVVKAARLYFVDHFWRDFLDTGEQLFNRADNQQRHRQSANRVERMFRMEFGLKGYFRRFRVNKATELPDHDAPPYDLRGASQIGRVVYYYLPWNARITRDSMSAPSDVEEPTLHLESFEEEYRSQLGTEFAERIDTRVGVLAICDAVTILLLHELLFDVLQHTHRVYADREHMGSDSEAASLWYRLTSLELTVKARWFDCFPDSEYLVANQIGLGPYQRDPSTLASLFPLAASDIPYANVPVRQDGRDIPTFALGAFGAMPFACFAYLYGSTTRCVAGIDCQREDSWLGPRLAHPNDWDYPPFRNHHRYLAYHCHQYRLALPLVLGISSGYPLVRTLNTIYGLTPARQLVMLNVREIPFFGEHLLGQPRPIPYIYQQRNFDLTHHVAGGCNTGIPKTEMLPHSLRRVCTYFPSLPSTNNNCLFACLFRGAQSTVFGSWELGDPDTTFNLMRSHCKIPVGEKIGIDRLGDIVKVFPLAIEVYILERTPPPDKFGSSWIRLFYQVAHPQPLATVRVVLHFSHYYYVARVEALNFRRCGVCYKWMVLTESFKRHLLTCRRCPACWQPCTNPATHRCKQRPVVDVGERSLLRRFVLPTEYIAEKQIYWADFETSPFGLGPQQHIVYAASVLGSSDTGVGGGDKPLMFYGLKSLEQFIKTISGLSGTMVFYNGSAFDFILIFQYLLHYAPKMYTAMVKEVILKDNRILSFRLGNLRFLDLYLFIRCSLKNACRDLKVNADYCKGEFDHHKMADFDALPKYHDEVVRYLRLDILALRECYQIYARDCWKNFNVNITAFVTLSHMAYSIWSSLIPKDADVHVPKLDEDEWFRRGLFGGRCGPQLPSFVSKQAKESYVILSANPEMSDAQFDQITDYLADMDVVSLYPAVMSKMLYPCGRFAFHEMTTDPREYTPAMQYALKRLNDSTDQRGAFYEVDIDCPTNLLTAFLQERDNKGGLRYNLLHKSHQVYTGVELKEAIRLGYRITHVYRYCVFPEMVNLFGPFVEKCFKLKQANPKGSVSNLNAKWVMNSVSGKQSQKVITSDYTFVANDADIRKAVLGPMVQSVKYLYGSENSNSGDLEGDDDDPGASIIGALIRRKVPTPHPTKCVYLGCWILGAARVWMSHILRLVAGYLLPEHMFYYTDTDSYKLHISTLQLLAKQDGVIGKELGMMADELDGGKIVRAIFLAPKTYICEYVCKRKPHRLKWKVRCKGFPHDEGEIDVMDVYAEKYAGHHDIIYELHSIEEEPKLLMKARCITFEMFEQMLANKARVRMELDTLKRALSNIDCRRDIGIFNVKLSRTMNKEHWWSQNKREPLVHPVVAISSSTPPTVEHEDRLANATVPLGFNTSKPTSSDDDVEEVKFDVEDLDDALADNVDYTPAVEKSTAPTTTFTSSSSSTTVPDGIDTLLEAASPIMEEIEALKILATLNQGSTTH